MLGDILLLTHRNHEAQITVPGSQGKTRYQRLNKWPSRHTIGEVNQIESKVTGQIEVVEGSFNMGGIGKIATHGHLKMIFCVGDCYS